MSSTDIRVEGSAVEPFDPNQPIGNRPLTEEEKALAEHFGLSEQELRSYTPVQLKRMEHDEWMMTWDPHTALGC